MNTIKTILTVSLIGGFSLVGCGATPTETAQEEAAVEEAAEPTPTPQPPTAEPADESPTNTPAPAEPTATPSPLPPTEAPPEPAEADNNAEDSEDSEDSNEESAVSTSGNPDLDYAQVVYVKATRSDDGTWRFDTTVRHNDQGWDDYADAWQVVDPASGEVLGERILLHPHDNEQPFTRSQSGITIPPEVTQVIVRAKDNVEGFGGQVVLVDLTVEQGEKFEVVRAP